MKISPEAVGIFHYTLRDQNGKELETSRGDQPTAYLHGRNNIVAGLETVMEGKEAGDVFSATVAPEDAYGTPDPERQQRVPIKHLIFKGKLKPGMVVQLNTSDGRVPVTVTKAGRHSADIDTNHPLAGQSLSFDIEILEVRAATEEEIAHGHAHGPGGHQH
ncbi:peptidylprolyl isomerase [Halioglobus japonicus]|uniref:Peptidyl-prolyl cis-trans isomerase n=1 Tax=Halioglobus japonicus TaxID=930805 RepID=A0AAP8MI18_9GAMM|nr:peptidylprolyl isomerase [Halioglobus japonicus]AQA19112.1 peptidylprolyl isomerase [Halioglobus japonicus]PLW87862.1 peptidylprolyl isomerase [Halioglobus japonicus]GHD06178.1 peptidyl-prolyl cis-trans isomerase [Halioglobus japonicus]